MPSSSQNAKRPNALALKQAANWQCKACGRQCRRHDESLDDFAVRIDNEVAEIAAHPRRWTLHVTKLDKHSPMALSNAGLGQSSAVLCGSCHRTHHNHQRWRQRQQQERQQQERIGQLTLNDIRLPLTGLQLSLNDWGTPYEIANPLSKKRKKLPKKS